MKRLESLQQYATFIQSFDTFLLDMDGVLWHGNQMLPGVQRTLTLLHGLGKRLIFISNNSTKSRSSYVDKFIQLGITHVKENQVFGSAYIAAGYLQSLPFDRSKHIYVIGEAGLTEELNNLGYLTCGGLLDKDLKYENVNSLSTIETDPKIGAVLCGLDGHINYMKLAKAHTYLMDPNVLFLATNMDTTFPTAGKTFPGAGSIFAPLVQSTGRTPIVLGKPDPIVGKAIASVFPLSLAATCMIGDRLETDIKFGQQIGCATLLVLSGVHGLLDVTRTQIVPDYVMDSLGDLEKSKSFLGGVLHTHDV